MKKLSLARLSIQLIWLALIILTLVSERASYFRTPVLLGTILLGPIYCGWFCVFGTFQELISKLGNKILKKRFKLPKRLHNYLKSFRYVILVMTFLSFLQSINNFDGRISFLRSIPKIKVTNTQPVQDTSKKTDISKTDMSSDKEVVNKAPSKAPTNTHAKPQPSSTFLWGIVLFYGILAFFVDRPFCNYLCVEGARYGILGKLRLFSIKRNESSCVNCKLCDKACPMNIEVSKEDVVQDAHCISCFACIDSCPKKDTLNIKNVF